MIIKYDFKSDFFLFTEDDHSHEVLDIVRWNRQLSHVKNVIENKMFKKQLMNKYNRTNDSSNDQPNTTQISASTSNDTVSLPAIASKPTTIASTYIQSTNLLQSALNQSVKYNPMSFQSAPLILSINNYPIYLIPTLTQQQLVVTKQGIFKI